MEKLGVCVGLIAIAVMASFIAAYRFGTRSVVIFWLLAVIFLLGVINTYVDLHLPE